MKLNHVLPAMAFVIAFGGCTGKSKTPSKEQAINSEETRKDEKSLTNDNVNNSGFYSNEPSVGNTTTEENRTEVDKSSNDEIYVSATSYGTSTSYNASVVASDSTSNYTSKKTDSKYNPLTSTGTTIGNDGIRKFVKTADLKFRVKSVIQATYDIEDITHRFDGFVANTNLESRVDNVVLAKVSADSTLETTYYTIANSMFIRVPEQKMDSALREMAPLVDYMDHRKIEVKDVHIQLMADVLTQTRLKNYQSRMRNNIDTKGRDLEDMNMAEENILSRQEQADNTTIADLTLQDKIEYATITINLYQRQAVKREVVATVKHVRGYQPGLGHKLKTSFLKGWRALEAVILFTLQFWVLFVLGIAGFIFWRWWSKR
jgi:hypothetical protein